MAASELLSAPAADPAPGRAPDPAPAIEHTYRANLDGLRSIAVYLVLLFHTGLPWAEGGFIGVDLFFVLSGFLVSTVLLDEIEQTGRLRVGRFYARRVRRLLPAAVVVVVATAATFTVIWSVVRRLEIVGDAQSALLYYANWHFLAASGDYFAADTDKSPYLHFWSLAIEEQYYVVFPVLLLLLSRFGRRFMLWSLLGLMGLSLAAQLYWAQVDTTHAYYGTDARLYQLLAGAALAVAMRRGLGGALTHRSSTVIGTVGLAGLLVLGSGLVGMAASWRGIGATVVAGLLIGGLVLAPRQPVSRALSRPVPVFLGRISYGTYLWHWPVIIALTTLLDTSPWAIAGFALALSTGLAALSYQVVEMPIRKAPSLNRFGWATAVVGVSASAVLAVSVVPNILENDRRPQLSETTYSPAGSTTGDGAGGDEPVPSGIDWEAAAADRGESHTCAADRPDDCIVERGSGPHVLFIGDSQAMSFVPLFRRMASEHDFTLSLNVTAGCPWQEGLANDNQADNGARTCESARVGWYDRALPELDPDIVVLLDRPRDDEKDWGTLIKRRDGKDQPLDRAVYETTQETLGKVSEVADKTVVVQRLVMPEDFNPLDCLASSSTIGQCAVAVPNTPSSSDGFYAAAAAQSDDIVTVNLNDVFCATAPVCQPMDGDQVVWRDDHHYTASYVEARSAGVWKAFQDAGVFTGKG
ncbi:acyltransferase family protein [Nocardioides guangzhouensis]|uniref:acyltransferase family protein n=1 Tax=Nocardioides guangzhouensis TaxID=2497878 RepID=UPI0014384D3E|nr:acyltransferase family protein [Nocardioides guangzhouensis]